MTYIKTNWKDQKVERPHTYESNTNADGTITLVDAFGNVEQMGTPVNAQNLNKIEDGIANSANVDLDNLSVTGQKKIDDKVNKTGDTMTGSLTINDANVTGDTDVPLIIKQRNAQAFGTSTYSNFTVNDKTTNNNICLFGGVQGSDGNNGFRLLVRNKENTGWTTGLQIFATDKPAWIVTRFVGDTYGYRIWSDGFIEQWGRTPDNGGVSTDNYVITFLKPFKTDNYAFNYLRGDYFNFDATRTDFCIIQRFRDRIRLGTKSGSGNNGNWQACGY